MKSFAELKLPESVARALRDRNYENAMPVQAAVLDERSAGRDLLVSSQTGSGKTIAFGLALAQTLLGEGATKFARRTHPAALVIVPTRELATQVRDELGWLLKHTGMRLASFTGGTAVSGDLVALKHGVDLAIGTPGRLVDLVQRGRLNLAELAVVVLDEADEMLDLGFREDLETLLKAAPAERRTLLLSATMPSAIRDMARQFQRDALPVDPRAEAGATRSAPHEDIAFVAHLIAGVERRAAVVNVLRASDAERAIVFCTTREGVGELHRYLVGRGFTATAISGDRAQAERDRALDQVRRGEARVLVATNVAARGIHLPDVDLIIHADLPLNAESLTHRSGRTGRAGRKGTAVLLATATDRRKAERLLASAHVKAEWTAPPSARQIADASAARLVEALTGDAAAVPGERAASVDQLLGSLRAKLRETELDDGELLRRLLARELERLPAGEALRSVAIPAAGSGFAPGADRRPRSRSEFAADNVLFRVNMGANDKAEARWLLPMICRRGGVTNREVGAIRIGPRETLFEIFGGAARDFEAAAGETDPRAPHVRIERADGPARGAPRPRTSRPEPRAARAPEARVERLSEPRAERAPETRAERAPEARVEREPEARLPDIEREPGITAAPERARATAPVEVERPVAAPAGTERPQAATAVTATEPPARGTGPHQTERPARAAGATARDHAVRAERPHRGAAKTGGPLGAAPRSYGPPKGPARRGHDAGPAHRPERPHAHAPRPFASKPVAVHARAPRPDREHRPARDDRPAREHRPARDDRPAREHRPARDDRPAAEHRTARDDRPAREHRPARDDRQAAGQRPARDDRSARERHPAHHDRPAREPRPTRDDRPSREHRPAEPARAAATPFHRAGFSSAPLPAAGQGHTPAFRARAARPGAPLSPTAPITIERKVHPPSHLRAQAHPRAKPRAK